MLEAVKLRTSYNSQAIDRFKLENETDEQLLRHTQGTLFEEYLKSAEIEQVELQKFSFSSYVTRRIIEDYSYSIVSLEDLFFMSKIVEHGYYKLSSLSSPQKLQNLLPVSKEFGVFHTPINLAREMAAKVVEGSDSKVIIDPCCGTGNLLGACLEYSAVKKVPLKKLVGIELDKLSSEVCRKSLETFAASLGLSVEIEILTMDAIDVFAQQSEIFGYKLPMGSIVINPPYGKIKFDSDRLHNAETRLMYQVGHKVKQQNKSTDTQAKIRSILKEGDLGKGTLEWSTIFLSLCIRYISTSECLVYLGPCGWLNSPSYSSLRSRINKYRLLNEIHFISEDKAGFETVNQSLSIVSFRHSSDKILIQNDHLQNIELSYRELAELSSHGFAIPRIRVDQIQLFLRLQHLKKFRDHREITNCRGEVDQSVNRELITERKTALSLIRGENFKRFSTIQECEVRGLFVNEEKFVQKLGSKPKGQHHKFRRIVGRQCSYMKQRRRLVFTISPANSVIGNSCNYLIVPDEDIYFYLGLLNSALYDWYFRVMNGNNHVANYEIDDFPLPECDSHLKLSIISETLNIINDVSKRSTQDPIDYSSGEDRLDALVFRAFNLTSSEAMTILQNQHDSEYVKSVTSKMLR